MNPTTQETAEPEKIYQWINELCMPATRENALIELRSVAMRTPTI